MLVKVLKGIFGETLSVSSISSDHSLPNNIFTSLSLDVKHIVWSILGQSLHVSRTFVKYLVQIGSHSVFSKSLRLLLALSLIEFRIISLLHAFLVILLLLFSKLTFSVHRDVFMVHWDLLFSCRTSCFSRIVSILDYR